MPPASDFSVAASAVVDNSPPAILATLPELQARLVRDERYEEARHLHELAAYVRRLEERARRAEGRVRFHHEVFRSRHLGPSEKIVLIAATSEELHHRDRAGGEDPGAFFAHMPNYADATGLSEGQCGKLFQKLDGISLVEREEVRVGNGHKRIKIRVLPAAWDPLGFVREEPRNQGGRRKPRCVRCGSERFTPVAWECGGCGVTYDALPYPPEEEERPEASPPAAAGDAAATSAGIPEPTGNLREHVYTQWGGVPTGNLLVGAGAGVGEPAGDPTPQLAGRPGGEVAELPAPATPEAAGEVPVEPTRNLQVGPEGGDAAGGTLAGGVPFQSAAPVREPQPAGDPGVHGSGGGVGEPPAEVPGTPTGKLRVGPPEELRGRRAWVAWRPETQGGRPVKPPYNPRDTRRRADVGDPSTWGGYEDALAASRRAGGGVGYVLTPGDPYAVADLDGCRDPETGRIEGWAREIVELLDSYTEVSPSGRGLHVWVRGELPGDRRRKGGVELYDRARYVTFTGEALPGYAEIRERRVELEELYRRTFGDPGASPPAPDYSEPNNPPTASDDELLRRATRVPWFGAVWGGDDSAYGGDASRGDYWTCRALALYTGDAAQIERLVRGSPRAGRSKGGRSDYWPRTVAAALRDAPPRRPSPPTVHTPPDGDA